MWLGKWIKSPQISLMRKTHIGPGCWQYSFKLWHWFLQLGINVHSYPHFLLRLLWNLECVNSLSNSLASSWKQYQVLSTLTYLTGNLRLDEIRCSNTLSYHKDRCSCRPDIMSPGISKDSKKLSLPFDHRGILILLNYYSSLVCCRMRVSPPTIFIWAFFSCLLSNKLSLAFDFYQDLLDFILQSI